MEELCKTYKNLSNENVTKFLDNFRFPMAYYHCLAIDYHLKKINFELVTNRFRAAV